MPPAARVTDMHVCPMVTPGTPPVPHVGGPIIPPCSPNVITGFMPQARVTDMCICVGPPDTIVKGSPTVLVNGLMAARIGDPTVHGGTITTGFPTVIIGEAGSGGSPGGGGLSLSSKAAATIATAGGAKNPLSPIEQRKAANAKLWRDPNLRATLDKAGVTDQDLELMFAKKKPLGFASEQQFAQFKAEMHEALKKSGLSQTQVGMKGTATTFFSENPSKPLGHHWDADPLNPGDYDLNLAGQDFLDSMKAAGATPSEKYGVFRTSDVEENFPELAAFSAKWSEELGRDVNFVGYPTATSPMRDTTEYVL